MRRFAVAAFFATIQTSTVGAHVTPKEDRALQRAGSAIASANICNFRADVYALGRFIDGQVESSHLDGTSVAQAMYGVLGSEAIVFDLMGLDTSDKRQVKEYCDKQYLLFGPTGTVMPGILKRPGDD